MNRLFAMAVVALFAAGCSSDKFRFDEEGTVDTGAVMFEVDASSEVALQTRATQQVQLPDEAFIPSDRDYTLTVTGTYRKDGAEEKYSESWDWSKKPSEGILLYAGSYTAKVSAGDLESEGERAACFGGEVTFEVKAREKKQQQITAALLNAAIVVDFDEWFTNYYHDVRITIVTAAGNEFTFTPDDSPRKVVYVQPGKSLELKGTAVKQTGTAVAFPRKAIGTSAARSLHRIVLKASQAGGAGITIDFEKELTEIDEEVIELNPEF